MADSQKEMLLEEAASLFLAGLAPGDATIGQQAVHQFVRWFGRRQHLDRINASEVANYAQRMSASDADYQKKLDILRVFLTQAKKAGWTRQNLAVHLKAKKGKAKLPAGARRKPATVISLTRQGYDAIKKELVALKRQRPQIVEEIRRAAEDKDFRENAPLDAARERLSHLEGRISELEETLKSATLVEEKAEASQKLSLGDSVVLIDLSSGEKLGYTIVNPREVDPAKGKVSSVSPIGRAVIGREAGDIIEIEAPSGRLRYRLEKTGR
jgi:transcription elongation factor GreA